MPNQSFEVEHGPSIIEMLWAELDNSYQELMKFKLPDGRLDYGNRDAVYKLKGVCQGLAMAIAIMTNPYNPDEDWVRDETAERYELEEQRRANRKRSRPRPTRGRKKASAADAATAKRIDRG